VPIKKFVAYFVDILHILSLVADFLVYYVSLSLIYLPYSLISINCATEVASPIGVETFLQRVQAQESRKLEILHKFVSY